MTLALPPRRSPYAEKLRAFPEFTFAEESLTHNQGTWRDLFARRLGAGFGGRVILEIGCFDASFLCTLAAKRPDTAFVGIDWKCKAIYDGAQRVAALGLRNVALLRGRAQDLTRVFAVNEVDEAILFHPEPCVRPNELPNRLVGESFLLDMHRLLRGDAVLSMKTDHPGYYECILALFAVNAPELFDRVRAGLPPGPSPTRAPRLRDLARASDVPPPSKPLREAFAVAAASADFWHDETALAHTRDRPFAGEATTYERRFAANRFPIHFLELRPRERP